MSQPNQSPPSLRKFKPDQKKREDGVLFEVVTTGDYPVARPVKEVGSWPTFLLANATDHNPKFAKALERHMASWRKAKEEGKSTDAELADLWNTQFRAAFVEASVLGWYNVEGGLTFSKDEASKLLEEIPDVENCLVGAAQDRRYFRIDLPGSVETDAKNS